MKKSKIRVAVLMGGPSREHEVSLDTGKMVLRHLDKQKYRSKRILITKKGGWTITFKKLKNDFDIAFNALHGEYGEDGALQSILNKHKIPYTGSGAKASKLGMDKERCFKLFEKNGFNVAKFTVVKSKKPSSKKIQKLGWPIVVKPSNRGSSVGLAISENLKELKKDLKTAFKYSDTIILQKYIGGKELTCGVIEIKRALKPLLPTEIIPKKRKTFDYFSKYTPNASVETTPPPRMQKKQIRKLQNLALKAHKLIGAKGYSRTDFILGKDKKIYILEINTLPGLTINSLVPRAAKISKISFSKLLDLIIEAKLKKS